MIRKAGQVWGCSYMGNTIFSQFCCESKTALKNSLNKKKDEEGTIKEVVYKIPKEISIKVNNYTICNYIWDFFFSQTHSNSRFHFTCN